MDQEETGSGVPTNARFEIYRKANARDYGEHNVMRFDDITPIMAEGLKHFGASDGGAGQEVSILFSAPGFSLTHVWFKSGYPLPLHAHTSDCLYYIIAGSVKMGNEDLGPGDGFFVGSDVPYTYTPGPNGVEVLEFRNTDFLNIKYMAKTTKAWNRIAATLKAREETWKTEQPPTPPAHRS